MKTAFEIICENMTSRFGVRRTPSPALALPLECKAVGWEIGATAFCVLKAAKGTVVPWNPASDGSHYLAIRIDEPRADRKGRSTAINRCSPLIGWAKCIAYLDVWTTFDLEQAKLIIETKQAGRTIPMTPPPEYESPSIDGRPVPLTPVYRAVMFRDHGMCVLCKKAEKIHLDHIIPKSRGGSDSLANLRVLCAACNLMKSDRV